MNLSLGRLGNDRAWREGVALRVARPAFHSPLGCRRCWLSWRPNPLRVRRRIGLDGSCPFFPGRQDSVAHFAEALRPHIVVQVTAMLASDSHRLLPIGSEYLLACPAEGTEPTLDTTTIPQLKPTGKFALAWPTVSSRRPANPPHQLLGKSPGVSFNRLVTIGVIIHFGGNVPAEIL